MIIHLGCEESRGEGGGRKGVGREDEGEGRG